MRKYLAAGVAVALLTLPLPSLAVQECADGLIHYPPFCLTEAEYLAQVLPATPSVAPRPLFVAGVEQWRPMVAYYWPAQHVDRMLRIMNCESRGIPTAKNPHSSARGLFQIMGGWQKTWPGDYFDPWTNAAVAYQIWRVQGYGAWVCRG